MKPHDKIDNANGYQGTAIKNVGNALPIWVYTYSASNRVGTGRIVVKSKISKFN